MLLAGLIFFLVLALVRAQTVEALEPGTTLLQISAFLKCLLFLQEKIGSIPVVG